MAKTFMNLEIDNGTEQLILDMLRSRFLEINEEITQLRSNNKELDNFNIYKKLENFDVYNKLTQLNWEMILVNTADLQKYELAFCSMFNLYGDQEEAIINNIKLLKEVLTLKCNYTVEEFFISLHNFLHKNLLEITTNQIYQNENSQSIIRLILDVFKSYDTSKAFKILELEANNLELHNKIASASLIKKTIYNIKNNNNTKEPILYIENIINCMSNQVDENFLEQSRILAKEDIKALSILLEDAMSPCILKVKDTNFTLEQKKIALLGVSEILNKFGFEGKNFFFSENNINTLSEKKLIKLFKLFEKCGINYISAEENFFYVDVLNIVYGVLYLNKIISKHQIFIDMFKHNLDYVEKNSDYYIPIPNRIKSLTKFIENVNKDQIEQYISRYYYNNYASEYCSFDEFKELIALLFDKRKDKLFLKEINLNNFDKPDIFFFYPHTVYFQTNQHYQPQIIYFCKNKKKMEEFINAGK